MKHMAVKPGPSASLYVVDIEVTINFNGKQEFVLHQLNHKDFNSSLNYFVKKCHMHISNLESKGDL